MRRTLLPILFALLFACDNLWAGGLFPGTGGGGGTADEITYDNSTSGLSATNVKDALDEVTTMAGTGGLASVDDLPGDTVDDNKIDVGLLPTGTTSSTLSLGNHTHASLYQPLDTDLTIWAGVTPSANGQALVAAANYAAMRTLLGLVVGTNVQAYSAILAGIAGTTPSSGYLHYTGSAYEWATPSGSSHDAVTLGADADGLLGLSTQQITLDSQSANTVFAAPNGSAGDPTFRALVDADIPDTITVGASGSVNDAAIPAGITRDTEWDTIAEIETATGADILTATEIGSKAQAYDADLGSLASGITGLVKGSGNGNGYAAAVAGTDYVIPSGSITGTAAGLTAQYIDWSASSGGASIANKPTLGALASAAYPGAGVPVSTGSAWGTSYTVGTSANNLVQLNSSAALPAVSGANLTNVNAATLGGATFAAPGAIGGTTPGAGTFTTLSAGASGFNVDADGDVTVKSLTVAKVSGTAGTIRAYEANSTDTSTVGWMGPASISASWDYQFSSTQPVANSIMLFGAPASNVSAQTWITLDDTGTNGDTTKIWSADKCYDQLALKANASHSHSGSDITSGTVSASYLPSVSGTTAGIVPTTSGVTDGYVLTKQSNGSAAWAAQTGGSGMTWPSSAGIAVYSGSSSWGTSLTAPSGAIVGTTDTQTLTNKTLSTGTVIPVTIGIACSDETTALTTGTAKATFRMPHAMTLTSVRASVGTAPAGSTIIVDINEGGSTIMTTNKLSIDAGEKTSTTAATAAGITDTSLADDAEITIDIDQVGSTTAGAGLKVWLIGTRTL